MFSSNDSDHKNRRRSFFHFGSSQTIPKHSNNKPLSNNGNTKSLSQHSDKPKSRVLDAKTNFNNPNTFCNDDHRAEERINDRRVPKVSTTSMDTSALTGEETNPKQDVSKMDHNPTRRNISLLRRPPPPPIDMGMLDVVRETPPLKTFTEECTSQTSSTDNTLRSSSYSPSKTPVVLEYGSSTNQHRRHLSEAEKLVDDLDSYIKEQKEMSQSSSNKGEVAKSRAGFSSSSFGDEIPLLPDTTKSENSSIESPLESPFTYVGPLDVQGEQDIDPHVQSALLASKRKSDRISDMDTDNDRFSFTNSLNDKSVRSIQHVALYDSKGAATVMTNYSYDYNNLAPDENTQKSTQKSKSKLDEKAFPLSKAYTNQEELSNFSKNVSCNDSDLDYKSSSSISEVENIDNGMRILRVANEDRSSIDSNDDGILGGSKNLRIVNEERPTFYLSSNHNHTASTSTTTIEEQQDYNEIRSSLTTDSGKDDSTFNNMDYDDIIIQAKNMTTHPKAMADSEPKKMADVLPSSDIGNTVNHESMKSSASSNNSSSTSPHPDKMVRLVSSYIEESRLKYYPTSNFLQAPPNLPISLKQKNNLIQPKNIKVRIRTSSKQIGIKHGGAKQKLLSLETTKEEESENASIGLQASRKKVNPDHTREFHNLLNKGGINNRFSTGIDLEQNRTGNREESNDSDYYLEDIPGDDAYDSDDAMAPLRENNHSQSSKRVSRSNTVVSYFTKNQQRLRSGTLDNNYDYLQGLPTNINIADYRTADSSSTINRSNSTKSDTSSILDPAYSNGNSLHVANPDL